MKTFLLFFAILSAHFGLSQTKMPVLAFYKQKMDGNYIGSIVSDYALTLFNDSSVRFEWCEKRFNSCIERTTYLGRYFLNNDTLTISYFSFFVERKPTITKKTGINNFKSTHPANVYILRDKKLLSPDGKYRIMDVAPMLTIKALETNFETWGTLDSGKALVQRIKGSGLAGR